MFRELRRRLNALLPAPWGTRPKAFAPGADSGGSFADAFSSQAAPTTAALVREFKGVVYACSVLNSQAVAAAQRRVYVTTSLGQRKSRWPTRKTLRSRRLAKARGSADETEEMLDHPLVALLEKPNPYMSGSFLIEMTDLYLELAGSAYWLIERDALRVPGKLWLLQTQLVTPHRSLSTGMVDYWEYGAGPR